MTASSRGLPLFFLDTDLHMATLFTVPSSSILSKWPNLQYPCSYGRPCVWIPVGYLLSILSPSHHNIFLIFLSHLCTVSCKFLSITQYSHTNIAIGPSIVLFILSSTLLINCFTLNSVPAHLFSLLSLAYSNPFFSSHLHATLTPKYRNSSTFSKIRIQM